MKVYERRCVKDWHIEAENGDRQECKAGRTYTTSRLHDEDATVTVFSGFWVRAPFDIFDPLPVTPENQQ